MKLPTLRHYTIKYRIFPENGFLKAQAKIELTHIPLGKLSFLLNPGLKITTLYVNGKKINYQAIITELEGFPGFKVLNTIIKLTEKTSDNATLQVEYEGHVKEYSKILPTLKTM